MAKNLVIVESPAKAKTIEGYLGKDFVVKSSFGHVRDLAKKGVSVDVENNFAPNYEISPDKTQLVAELRKLVKKADVVWLATDEDREGEAISWHLYETLGLEDKETKRITFNEITKKAILKSIESPREINQALVNAQQARRILDRLVGFELSPVLWRKIRPSLSAGRVQSVAVRLIVERERKIQEFNSESYYKVVGTFRTDKGTIKSEVSKQITSEDSIKALLESCRNADFSVADVTQKPATKKPAAPFTTSTLQQEASLKLGFTVSRTMQVAQRLYESGKITYMRTDSVNLSDTALDAAKAEIEKAYGSNYSMTRKYKTKSSNAQEAHEAVRPTEFSTHSIIAERDQEKLYDLIWKRAISSQMSDAQLERTNIKMTAPTVSETFTAKGEVIKFDGFLKVYLESSMDDDEDDTAPEGLLPAVKVGDSVDTNEIVATQRFSRPPSRYAEASLVKEMEGLGIGRPSTYAPTISTIQKRGYVDKPDSEGRNRNYDQWRMKAGEVEMKTLTEVTGREKNKLAPTDIGILVTDFLVEHFSKILDYNFTAKVEQEFDEIANGLVEWTEMIQDFYTPFHDRVEDTLENSERVTGERELGMHPENGRRIIARLGKFGPMVQLGDEQVDGEKAEFASLRKDQSINSISLDEALELFQFPKSLGEYESLEVIVAEGRFGPYVKFNEAFVSIPKDEAITSVDLARAIELIELKREADAPIAMYEDMPVQQGTGRFGPFIKWNELFINVSKKYDFDNLSKDDIIELIEVKKQKEIDKMIHNWEEEGISVQKARWGRFNIIKGKTKIEMPKTTDAEALTLEEVKAIIEAKAPKKKAKAKAKPKAKSKAKVKAKK
ncbi:MAG: type I DNA topoisomerase [Crocinitomicaceae bacterium]|nr:type I DNA topoisomerase [Flavobacteriales bacterium]NQZ34631.1 type I DNA topoisomerase [Crocinitomicaceae bacterium]